MNSCYLGQLSLSAMEETKLLYYVILLLPPFLYLILNHITSPKNLPPGPFPWPLIGNLLNLGNKPHVSLANLAATHGPLISLRLGTKLLVVGSSPSAATEILRNHDQILSARSIPHAVPVWPDRLHLSIAWTDCNDKWKYLRAICRTELFSSKAIESQARIRNNKVSELIEFLHTKEGGVVKIADVVFVTIFNMLTSIFMSKDFISLREEREDIRLRASVRMFVLMLSAPNLEDYYTILSGFDLQGRNKRASGIFDEIGCMWKDVIQERRANKDGDVRERDFLDGLIKSGFSDEQINYLFMEQFTAGADTSTSTVEWALAELIKDQEAMRKVRFELETVLSTEKVVKESDLPHLPYLHSVVKETLRLHPPAPLLLPHRASETCKVMNYTIPKDTQVYVNVWAIGRDPKVWDDPITFKPERFLDSCMDFHSRNHTYTPFGAGRRICPGLPMAAKQVALILAGLVQSFDWCLPHEENLTELDMEEEFGISLQKEKPLVLSPRPILDVGRPVLDSR